ncbi:muramidase family protein [Rubellicoccus peritrichatus]|uniref:LysM peptidoglycan-binding domain-containing protein n=1 Tax=Rubellicoccus peritrichatus TaxID=3080537 RepID=A0AAQ3LD18_9BACT|nr:LysM peptidoglycan-binding domain-containing protein [Puniceicoccus sp. CR14]WOO43551.1 LysM peptidoglycan-binding domain-containing protein [Puniceicoccus sp. CR14]
MKLSQTITIVVLLHIGVIGSLFVFPGCSWNDIRPQGDRVASEAGDPAHAQENVSHFPQPGAPVESPDVSTARLEPTRPSWNISSDPEPEVIAGFDAYEETDFNAINPELTDMETVVVVQEETNFSTAPVTSSYTVVKGDNLTKIARANGVGLNELMAANGMNKNSVLQIGQVLTIPAASSLAGPESPRAPTLSPSNAGVEGRPYEVQRGDTLGAIANRNGTTVSALRSVNRLSGDSIYVGQTLLIPDGSTPLASLPAPKPAAVETGPGETAYVVRAGDTLGGIARRYNLTVRELADRNNISDPRKMRAGATLVIPNKGSTRPAPSAPAPKKPEILPVPAPSTPPIIIVEEVEEPETAEVIVTEDFDYENLDDIPVVPVETTE